MDQSTSNMLGQSISCTALLRPLVLLCMYNVILPIECVHFCILFFEDRKTFHSQDRKIFLFLSQKRYFYSQDRLALLFLGKEIFLFLGKKDISTIRKQTQANELQHQTTLYPGAVTFRLLYAIGKAPCIQTLQLVVSQQNTSHQKVTTSMNEGIMS